MRILFVLENYFPHIGGVEMVFKNLCEGLSKKGHKVIVVTHLMKGAKIYERMNGVDVHRVRCFQSRYIFTFFSIPAVLRFAEESDIVHTTTFNGAFPAWLGAKIRVKPLIITVHEVWVGKWQKLTNMGWIKAKVHDFL